MLQIDIQQGDTEKYSVFLKKNRDLRIDIKSLLCQEKESMKKIDEMKKSLGI